MKLTLPTAVALLAAASASAFTASPDLAGPEPYSNSPAAAQQQASPFVTKQDGSTALRTPPQSPNAVGANDLAPNLYIVEFEASAQPNLSPALSRRDSIDAHSEQHEAFTQHMKRAVNPKTGKKARYTQRYKWSTNLFHGVSVKLQRPEDVAVLQSAPGVLSITQARYFRPPAFQAVVADPEFARGLASPASPAPASNVVPLSARAAPTRNDTFSPHVMTGVDKLHAQGKFGKGITVGVFDTGIDYTHPALNSGKPSGTACFGAGCQISGGRDFVGDAYTGANTPQPDADPFANCPGSGHGTHVTGTIIANSVDPAFTGVVPEAQAKMYRIFGCGDKASVTDDVIIQALTYAFFDKVDIMSLSIGGSSGWQESAGAAVASRVSAQGIPVVVANGNGGSDGAFAGESPAAGKAVTAVGSVDNTQIGGYTIYTVDQTGPEKELVMLTARPWPTKATLPLVAVSTDPNVTDDGCDKAKVAQLGDLTGKVVLVGRGTCPFVDKFNNIYAQGARNILVYNTPAPAGLTYPSSNHEDLSVAALKRDDGLYLKAQFAAGTPIKIDFGRQKFETLPDTTNGGRMSSFSSVTPFWELSIGAQVSAPGGNILSTWPLPLGGYAIISGTSMATPFISGSYAMYLSINGKKQSSTQLRSIFTSTATPVQVVSTTAGAKPLDTVAKQGGGLTDVYKAVYTTAKLSAPGYLALNDTRHFGKTQTFTVTNSGKKALQYTLAHQPAGTILSVDTATTQFNAFPIPIAPQTASVSFGNNAKFTLAPGKSRTVSVSFTPPAGIDPAALAVYSGYIKLNAANDALNSLSVPYAGVLADLYTEKVLDTTDVLDQRLPAITDANGTLITDDSHVFTLQKVNGTADAPTLLWRLRLGAARETIDLVQGNTTFKPTIPINDSQAKSALALARRHAHIAKVQRRHTAVHAPSSAEHEELAARAVQPLVKTGPKYADTQIVGQVASLEYQGRDTAGGMTKVELSEVVSQNNGTSNFTIPDGEYRLLLRVSKLFNDREYEGSYESYLSHKFKIEKPKNGTATPQ